MYHKASFILHVLCMYSKLHLPPLKYIFLSPCFQNLPPFSGFKVGIVKALNNVQTAMFNIFRVLFLNLSSDTIIQIKQITMFSFVQFGAGKVRPTTKSKNKEKTFSSHVWQTRVSVQFSHCQLPWLTNSAGTAHQENLQATALFNILFCFFGGIIICNKYCCCCLCPLSYVTFLYKENVQIFQIQIFS